MILVGLGCWLGCVAAPARVLTVDEAQSLALQQAPAVKSARESLDRARAQRRQAVSGFLPKASASASRGRAGAVDGASNFTGGADSYSVGLNGGLNLFNGGQDAASLSQAGDSVAQSEASLRQAEADAAAAARDAFYEVLYADRSIVLGESIVSRRDENARMVELRYDAGREHMGSVLRARASLLSAKADQAQAVRARALDALRLADALGLPADEPVEVKGEFIAVTPPAEEDLTRLALSLPSVTRAAAALASAETSTWAAWGGFLPTLDLSAGTSRSGDSWYPSNQSWNAGLSLNLQLFSGGSRVFKVQAARAAELAARADYDAALRNARESLLAARNSVAAAADSLQVAAASLQATQTQAEIGRSQYDNGLMDFTEWNTSESDLISAQKQELSSKRDAAQAVSAWRKTLALP